jgi:hypothetical protein
MQVTNLSPNNEAKQGRQKSFFHNSHLLENNVDSSPDTNGSPVFNLNQF